MTTCFHCGLAVPAGTRFAVTWNGESRAVCCRGCEAVAQAIVNADLGDYYRVRSAPAHKADNAAAPIPNEFAPYDHPAVQRPFVRDLGAEREATLILEGVTCPACVWLNEQHLRRLAGVSAVRVNYATCRVQVAWDDARIHLSDILQAVRAIGYRAHPYDPARSQQLLAHERRALLRRLGVAGVAGAQVMTLAVALYVGDWSGSDPRLRTFFYWVSLLLSVPILCYSAQPFFRTAWNDLRRGRAGMDVPVALGMIVAFGASTWTTVTGVGTIYFDSVATFTFFLLASRYLELAARGRATAAAEALAPATPAVANRIDPSGTPRPVPVAELLPGDTVLVRPGETIPADGVVETGTSSANEALLTGESLPVAKRPGAAAIGGSINVESPLTVRVDRIGADTVLANIMRLLDRAQAEKPPVAQLADRVASWFVAGVLVLAALVALYWWWHDPARTLEITIAVLVVTCPCALGLATPAALTAATGALARAGLLVTRGGALETLARADEFVFDKTGTLTLGELTLHRVVALADIDTDRCLAAAAALERHGEHPIARAIAAAAPEGGATAVDVVNFPGDGVRGVVGGETLYIGTARFIEAAGVRAPDTGRIAALARDGRPVVMLADHRRLLAAFVLQDELRPGAARLIAELKRLGRKVALVSGDRADAVRAVGHALGIEQAQAQAQLRPADKLAYLRRRQAEGAIVAMTGDGVNDAPVLAAAQVSIAMGSAAAISAASADMLLLARDFGALREGVHMAYRAVNVIRQNFAWALAYNLVAVPAAAAGYITPWIAALGMSVSSLVVVANALRLTKLTATESGTRADANP